MKINILVGSILFLLLSTTLAGQTAQDSVFQRIQSLRSTRDSLNKELRKIDKQLNTLEKTYNALNKSAGGIKEFTIDSPTIKLRDRPNAAIGNVIHVIPSGEELVLLEYASSYFQVNYQGQIGYLHEMYVANWKAHSKTLAKNSYSKKTQKRQSKSRSYIRGPRGGCYYINSNGNKTYVSRNLCG